LNAKIEKKEEYMTKIIDYYVGLASPWTYLGHGRFTSLCKKHDAKIRLKPINFGAVFEATGGLPVFKRPPARQAYRMGELKRWQKELDTPINLEPKFFPIPDTAAAFMVIAAAQEGNDIVDFAGAYMRAVWAEDKNIADTETLQQIATDAGFDGAALSARSQEADIQEIYNRYTAEAIGKGVFGAPTYIIDDEILWGQDRLSFVEKYLKEQ
jgi:2-hydroxychromene-2-carboxylate isomerase